MAVINGQITIDGVLILNTDTNPTTGGGTVAPIGAVALASDGSGTFTKTGSLDTNWNRNLNISLFGSVRYIYLVQDATDQANLGGTTNNVYTTFQTAYDAANTLQTTLGGSNVVVVLVGNTTSATVGNLTLTANFNSRVNLVGLSPRNSFVGSIISNNASGSGFTIGTTLAPLTFTSVNFVSITTNPTGTTGNGGQVAIIANSIQTGAINTSVTNVLNTTGSGGNISFTATTTSADCNIGSIVTTSQGTATNSGTVTVSNKSGSIGSVTTAVNTVGGGIAISNCASVGTITSTVSAFVSTGLTLNNIDSVSAIALSYWDSMTVNINASVAVSSLTINNVGTQVTQVTANIRNSIITGYTSTDTTGVLVNFINSTSNTFFTNLGNNSTIRNSNIISAVATSPINGIGTGCSILNSNLTGGTFSISNGVAVTVKSDKSTFSSPLDTDVTIELDGGVQTLAGDPAWVWEASSAKQASITFTSGGANTLAINSPSIGETYILYLTQTVGLDTLTFPAGSIFPTGFVISLLAGQRDRLIMTYDGTNYWWTINNNFA